MYKKYSSIRIRAVIYERDTNGDYELDTNGDKIVEQYLNYPATNSEYLIEIKENFATPDVSPLLMKLFRLAIGVNTNGDYLSDNEITDIVNSYVDDSYIHCITFCNSEEV